MSAAPRHAPIKYPLKVGNSLRGRATTASRDILTIKFTHVPERAQLDKPATLCRKEDKCTVELPTAEGGCLQFAGRRISHKPDSPVNDYVLVLVDGVMWLERTADHFIGLRPVDGSAKRPAPNYPSPEVDDPLRDPDSWMPGADASASPITPEDDAEIDDVPPVPLPRSAAGKSTTQLPQKRKLLVSAGRVTKPDKGPPQQQQALGQRFAGKGVASKGIAPGPHRREPVEHGNPSSSEEDDSEDSDTDSSDSDDYTDRSSDEDD